MEAAAAGEGGKLSLLILFNFFVVEAYVQREKKILSLVAKSPLAAGNFTPAIQNYDFQNALGSGTHIACASNVHHRSSNRQAASRYQGKQ